MRPATARTIETIKAGGFDKTWVFDLMYDGERRLANVPVAKDPDMTWDGSSFVAGSGKATVVWSDSHARSLIPRQIGDWFSPFGADLQVDCLIGGGVFTERIQMGRFMITGVPDASEANMLWEGRLIHPGESFTVEMKDPLTRVLRDEFPFPTAPKSSSAWTEIGNLTGMPVIRNLPDTTVPALSYEGSREDPLKAIFDRMDAWPHVDPSGALTARPKAWPDVVDTFDAVVAAPPSMTSTYTYNRVVVVGKSPDGEPLYGVREVTDGYLRVRNANGAHSPFGGATYRYASDWLTTQTQVDEYATQLLPRVARIRSVTREITERFNPLREVGDVVRFNDTRRYGDGLMRVQKVSHPGGETRTVVEVPDA